MVFNFGCTLGSTGEGLKQLTCPTSVHTDSEFLELGPGICRCRKLPADSYALRDENHCDHIVNAEERRATGQSLVTKCWKRTSHSA